MDKLDPNLRVSVFLSVDLCGEFKQNNAISLFQVLCTMLNLSQSISKYSVFDLLMQSPWQNDYLLITLLQYSNPLIIRKVNDSPKSQSKVMKEPI